jgi:YesN/AraC family two-component response regulator
VKLKEAAVLFVEDEALLRDSISAWLARKVGRVMCAQDGAEALKILAANKIDLLLTDLRMPLMDGIALIKEISKAGPRPRLILVTGFYDPILQEAYKLDLDAVVEKPIDREELLHAMRNCLGDADEINNKAKR